MSFNPKEIATVRIGGVNYGNWTRIEVERAFPGVWSFAALDTIESAPMGKPIKAAQIMPGNPATVWLGGQLAITGHIYRRTVDYGKENHDVKVAVFSDTKVATDANVKVRPGEYKQQTFQQIASAVLAPYGIKIIVGAGPGVNKPFPIVHEIPGETVIAFVERLARHRGLHITDNAQGNMLFDTLTSAGGGSATFVEGGNILHGRVIMQAEYGTVQMEGKGESPGGKAWGQAGILSADPYAMRQGANIFPNATPFRSIIAEMPVDNVDLQMRLGHQVALDQMTIMEATLTVSGWFAPSGQLWVNMVSSPPVAATLKSPMLIPASTPIPKLFIKRVRSYQNDQQSTCSDVTIAIYSSLTGQPMMDNETPPSPETPPTGGPSVPGAGTPL